MAAIPTTAFNPIRYVKIGATTYRDIPCPSSYSFEWEDVSKSSAGRTEDGTMHKELMGHVLAFNLKWNALTYSQMATLLERFKPEYIKVSLLSPDNDTDFVEKTFYVGNRSGALFNTNTHRWENLSFKIIEQALEV